MGALRAAVAAGGVLEEEPGGGGGGGKGGGGGAVGVEGGVEIFVVSASPEGGRSRSSGGSGSVATVAALLGAGANGWGAHAASMATSARPDPSLAGTDVQKRFLTTAATGTKARGGSGR